MGVPGYMWVVIGLLVMCLAGILWIAIELDALGNTWAQEDRDDDV